MFRSMSSRPRPRVLLAAVATVLLLALVAGMAVAAGSPPPGPPVTPAHGHGYGYGGYGYGGYGYGGYGYGYGTPCTSRDACPFDRWDAYGSVYDQAAYDAAVARGSNAGSALAASLIPGASVTLQRQVGDGPWADVPASELTPAANPITANAQAHFIWLIAGQGALRVVASAPGYVTAPGPSRPLANTRALDVGLVKAAVIAPPPVPDNGGGGGTPGGGAGVGGQGAPLPPKPVVKPVAKPQGCAAKKGAAAKAACLRAEKLTKALRACRPLKGAKRAACAKRTRALSACDAKKGKKRTACRTRAKAVGRPKRGHR
jgi:hypothetical protein